MVLNCNFGNRNFISISGVYTCDATIDFTGTDAIVADIRGSHLAGKHHGDVRGISFSNHVMRNMLSNINGSFPNIQVIQIVNMRLESISNTQLSSFPQLRNLEITNNYIQSVNKNLFSYNSQLQAVILNNNPMLRHVDYRAFEDLRGLRFLQLNNNECITNVTVNNNHEEISTHFFNIFRQCPITTRMIQDEIMSSDELTTIKNDILELQKRECECPNVSDEEKRLLELKLT